MQSSPAGADRVRAALCCHGATQPLPFFPGEETAVVRRSEAAPVMVDRDAAGLATSRFAWPVPATRRPAMPGPASPQPA
jgi:hypothetical protein